MTNLATVWRGKAPTQAARLHWFQRGSGRVLKLKTFGSPLRAHCKAPCEACFSEQALYDLRYPDCRLPSVDELESATFREPRTTRAQPQLSPLDQLHLLRQRNKSALWYTRKFCRLAADIPPAQFSDTHLFELFLDGLNFRVLLWEFLCRPTCLLDAVLYAILYETTYWAFIGQKKIDHGDQWPTNGT